SVVRDTTRTAREFEFVAYFDPHTSKLILGPARYMGITTSDKLLLPPGLDKNLGPLHSSNTNAGRPLHPLEAKESELIGKKKADNMYWDHMIKNSTFRPAYKFDNSLPFWFQSRQRKPIHGYPYKTGWGTTAGMYEDRKAHQQHCVNCF
ncbi:MAG: hypothetical protein ACXADH_11155, partial [Candidatus Kariarchaeaceae archaeon]